MTSAGIVRLELAIYWRMASVIDPTEGHHAEIVFRNTRCRLLNSPSEYRDLVLLTLAIVQKGVLKVLSEACPL